MTLRKKLIIGFGSVVVLIWILAGWALSRYYVAKHSLSLAQTYASDFMPANEESARLDKDFLQTMGVLEENYDHSITIIWEIAFIITVVAIATGALTSRSILRPLKQLREGTSRIAAGELDYRLNLSGGDEVSALSHAFDDMSIQLASSYEALEGRVKQRTETLSETLQTYAKQKDQLENNKAAMLNIMEDLQEKQTELIEEVRQRSLAEEKLKARIAEVEMLNKGVTNLLEDLQEANRLQAQTTARLEAANRDLESFSYSVSHDLRAPLRAINGFAEAFMEDAGSTLNKNTRHYLDVITKNARNMGQLIDDLLSFSRLGRKPLELSLVDMNGLVKEIVSDVKNTYPDRQIKFNLSSLPKTKGDAALIRQIWVNLISNAVKFTGKKNKAVITISSKKQDEDLIYIIEDNGAGFNMDYADKLFGVFQRLHKTEEYEGTGVGLATAQRIISRHGGNIWAKSEIGQGATFSFSLPVIPQS